MSQTKLLTTSLLGLLTIAVVSIHLLLPRDLALVIGGLVALTFGISFGKQLNNRKLAWLALALFLAGCAAWFRRTGFQGMASPHSVAGLTVYLLFLASGNHFQTKWKPLSLFFAGWILATAQSTFNGDQSIGLSVLGFAFAYVPAGYLAAKSSISIPKQAWLLVSVAIVFTIEAIVMQGMPWQAYTLPMYVVMLLLGNGLAHLHRAQEKVLGDAAQ
jgi:hypothetical protein